MKPTNGMSTHLLRCQKTVTCFAY